MSLDSEKSEADTDQLVNLYLRSQSDTEAEPILIDLMNNHAEPLIRKIVLSKTSTRDEFGKTRIRSDAEDLCSSVKVKLLTRLRRLRSSSKTEVIESFLDYVAVASFNACNDYFRQLNPVWLRIRNHLRYVFNHQPDFALWKTEKELVCGFAKWKRRNDVCPPETLKNLLTGELSENATVEQLGSIFEKIASPARFTDVVNLFAESIEGGMGSFSGERLEVESLADTTQTVDKDLELKTFLQELWNQIMMLSLKQRSALLLSLRDENGSAILHFLPMLGIAKIKELAELLEIQVDTFAGLWRNLPLEDNQIAEYLQVTRQQVINLRKCARERLVRRLRSR